MANLRTGSNKVSIMIATLVLWCVFMAVGMYFPVYGAEIPSYIKVGLKYGSSARTSVTLTSGDGFQLGMANSDGVEETMPLPAYNQVIATVENGQVVLKDPDGTLLSTGMAKTDCIMPMDYEGSGLFSFEGKQYRGGVILLPNGNGSITVINYLPLEYYVYGVLNNEMGGGYPLEALKAQAVAARSYAAVHAGTHSKDGFDVCTTVHCQVYSGYEGEHVNANRAVDETEGLLLYSEGKPVTAFYYKNSGGHTQNSEDVWSSKEPYLRAVEDIYSPEYSWTATIPFSMLQSKLEAAGYHPGKIQSVEIKSRNSAGAVAEVEIIGESDTVILKKESVRTLLDGSQVKSTMFDMEGEDQEAGEGEKSGGSIIGGINGRIQAGSSLYVLPGNEVISKMSTSQLFAFDGMKLKKMAAGIFNVGNGTPLTGGLTRTESDPLILRGKGFGHGVGMPQDSAIEMAKQGKSFEEILEFYYTGSKVR